MLKELMYGTLGIGAVGAFSICDLCKPQTAGAAPSAVVAAAPVVAAQRVVALAANAVEEKTVRLTVEGMTCGGCAIGTKKVLTRLTGVTKAEVSYEKKEAVVTYDPAKVTVKQMIAAIKTLGYTATVAPSTTQG